MNSTERQTWTKMEEKEIEEMQTSGLASSTLSDTTSGIAPGAEPPAPINHADHTIFHSLSAYPWATDAEYQRGLASILGHPDRSASPGEINRREDLVLQAQCFYFSRKYNVRPPINYAAYRNWLKDASLPETDLDGATPKSALAALEGEEHASSSTVETLSEGLRSGADMAVEVQASATTPSQSEQPPYPTSFAEIVELITNNRPIPGIEEIPNTVLDLGSSKQDKQQRRLKPWENPISTPETGSELAPHVLAKDTADLNGDLDARETRPISSSEAGVDLLDSSITSDYQSRTRQGVVHILQPTAISDGGLLAKD